MFSNALAQWKLPDSWTRYFNSRLDRHLRVDSSVAEQWEAFFRPSNNL